MSGVDREVARLLVQLEAEVNGLRRGLKEGDRAWASHVQDVKGHLDRIKALEDQHNRTREITKKNSLSRQIADEKMALAQMHQAYLDAERKRDAAEKSAAAERKARVKEELAFRKSVWDASVAERKAQMREEAATARMVAREKIAAEKQAAKEQAAAAREMVRAQRESAKAQEQYVNRTMRAQENLQNRLRSVERTAINYARRGATLAAMATGLIGLKAIKTAGQFEQAEVAFAHMLGSGVKSKKFLDELKEFAATTPFEFTELADQAKRLMAVGFAADEVLPTLTKVGDAVASLGLDNSRMNRVVLALSQMRNAASISAQDMRQLTEAGIPVWDMLTKGLNERGIKAKKQDVVDPYWRKDKGLTGNDGFNIILEQMGRRYQGMMKKQSSTLLGLWSNFKDRLTYLMIDIGNMIIKRFDLKDKLANMVDAMKTGELQAKIMGVVETIVRLTEKVIEIGKWLYEHRETIKAVAEAYAVLHVQLRAMFILGSITGALRMYTGAAAASAVASRTLAGSMAASGGASLLGSTGRAAGGMGLLRGAMMAVPFGPWGLAALAAGTGAYYLWKHIDSSRDSFKKLSPGVQDAADRLQRQRDASENAKDANKRLEDATKKVADALEKSGKKSKAYKDALLLQKDAAKDAAAAEKELKDAQDSDGNGKSGDKGDTAQNTVDTKTTEADLTRLLNERKRKFRELQEAMAALSGKSLYETLRGDTGLGLSGKGASEYIAGGNRTIDQQIAKIEELKERLAGMYSEGDLQDPVLAGEYLRNVAQLDNAIQRLKDRKDELGDTVGARWDDLDENKDLLEELYHALGKKAPWEDVKKNAFDSMNFIGRQIVKSTPIVQAELRKMLQGEGLPSMSNAGVVRKMLEGMDEAKLIAAYGTADINKILARAGLTKPDPKWKDEFAESNRRAREDAREAKEKANAQLAAIGKVKAATAGWGDSLIKGIQSAVGAAKEWAGKNPVQIGINALLSLVGVGGDDNFGGGNSSTKGLKPQMHMPLMIGNRMGLGMSSGFRGGATTKEGKRSDHSTGNAIDMVGSATEMAAYYRVASNLPGAKQVIYSPLDGWSNDHYDHVHVAMRRHGGFIPGSSHRDTVPALLTQGEYVFTREAVKNAGGAQAMDALHGRLNAGPMGDDHGSGCGCVGCGKRKYRNGGMVGDDNGRKSKKKPKWKPSVQGRYIDPKKDRANNNAAANLRADIEADPQKKLDQATKGLFNATQAEKKNDAAIRLEEKRIQALKKQINSGKMSEKAEKAARKTLEKRTDNLDKLKDRDKDLNDKQRDYADEIVANKKAIADKAHEEMLATPRTKMLDRDGQLSVASAMAGLTADRGDDVASAQQGIANEQSRQAEINAILARTDLSPEERNDKMGELASSINAMASYMATIRDSIINMPANTMMLGDAVMDLKFATAEGTETKDDDLAARQEAIQREKQRQALIQSVLNRGDLSEQERADKTREMAASLREVSGHTEAIKQLQQTNLEEIMSPFNERNSANSFGTGNTGGADSSNVNRSEGGASGVGYVPDPTAHPVFFDGEQINDLDFESTSVGVKIMSIHGWDEGEELRYGIEERAGENGSVARDLRVGISTITIKGIVLGEDIQDYYTRRRALKTVLQVRTGSDEVILKMPDPEFTGTIDTVFANEMNGYHRKECRVVKAVTWGDRIGTFGSYFEVTLVSTDARRYTDVMESAETTTVSGANGRSYPRVFPTTFLATADGGDVTVVNDGDFESPAVFKIYGPCVNPQVDEIGGDGRIVFEGLELTSSEYVEIDMLNHTTYRNGDPDQNVLDRVSFANTRWWHLPPGASSLRLSAGTIELPAKLRVEFRPAYL